MDSIKPFISTIMDLATSHSCFLLNIIQNPFNKLRTTLGGYINVLKVYNYVLSIFCKANSAFFSSGSTFPNSIAAASAMIYISPAFLFTYSTSLFTYISLSLAWTLSTYKTCNNFLTFSEAISISGYNLARFIFKSAIYLFAYSNFYNPSDNLFIF